MLKEKGIDNEPCPREQVNQPQFLKTTCFQIMAKGRTLVAVSALNPKRQLRVELAQELAADREESAADVLKQRGWRGHVWHYGQK